VSTNKANDVLVEAQAAREDARLTLPASRRTSGSSVADNTTIDPGTGGDTLRDKDRAGIKTPIVA
jgi:hypothetical protein